MKEGEEGDSDLSGQDHRFWQLHQHIVLRWGCYTIFKYHEYNVPERRKGLLMWFVPADHTHRYEVVEFLEKELKPVRQEPRDVPSLDYYFPGVDAVVSVKAFSGIAPYVDVATSERLGKELLASFMAKIKKK